MNELFTNEKHYLTLNNYLKNIYNEKVFKVSLNGNFSCPNRDGKISTNGCIFCSAKGSGDFAGSINLSIKDQFYEVASNLEKKWPNGAYIAYFQANTNTYGTVTELKQRYEQIIMSTYFKTTINLLLASTLQLFSLVCQRSLQHL